MAQEGADALRAVAQRGALLEYPCFDEGHAAQGRAIFRVRRRERIQLFLEREHCAASDGYYQ
eukprot:10009315-Lingulodinium_polyedra.AAC.1